MSWSVFFSLVVETIKKAAIAIVKQPYFNAIQPFSTPIHIARLTKQALNFKDGPKAFVKKYIETQTTDKFEKWLSKWDTKEKALLKIKKYSINKVEENIPFYKFFKRINKRIEKYKQRQIELLKAYKKLEIKKAKLRLQMLKQEQKLLREYKKLLLERQKEIRREARSQRQHERSVQEDFARQKRERLKQIKMNVEIYERMKKRYFQEEFDKDQSTHTITSQPNDVGEVYQWDTFDYYEFYNHYLNEKEREELDKWMNKKGVYVEDDKPKYIQGRKDIGDDKNYQTLNSKMEKFNSSWIKEAQWIPLWVFRETGKGYSAKYNTARTRGLLKLKLKKTKNVKLPPWNKSGIYVWWNISLFQFNKIIRDKTGKNFWKVFYRQNRDKLIYITTKSKYYKRKDPFSYATAGRRGRTAPGTNLRIIY